MSCPHYCASMIQRKVSNHNLRSSNRKCPKKSLPQNKPTQDDKTNAVTLLSYNENWSLASGKLKIMNMNIIIILNWPRGFEFCTSFDFPCCSLWQVSAWFNKALLFGLFWYSDPSVLKNGLFFSSDIHEALALSLQEPAVCKISLLIAILKALFF